MTDELFEVRMGLQSNPYEWLAAHSLGHHFVGCFEELDHGHKPHLRLRLVVVLNNRSTALMMKLALG